MDFVKRRIHTVAKYVQNQKLVAAEFFSMEDMQKLLNYLLARSSSPKELPLEALTEPDVKLSLHPALIIQPQIYQWANNPGFLPLKAQTRPMACAVLLSFLYLRFAQQLSFLSKWNNTWLVTPRPYFP